MATRSYLTYYGNDANFEEPHPTLASLVARFGQGTGIPAITVLGDSVVLRETTPTAIAMLMLGDEGNIHILHRPTILRGGALNGTYVGILGAEEDGCLPSVIQAGMFDRLVAKPVAPLADIVAHLTGGAIFAPDPGAGDPGVAPLEARRAIVLPTAWVARGVGQTTFTHLEFYNEFLLPLTAGPPAELAAHQEWVDWWRYTVTALAGAAGAPGAPNSRQPFPAPLDLRAIMTLGQYMRRRMIQQDLIHVAPPLAPGALTGTVVQDAMGQINTTLTDQEAARVARQEAKANRTVTDRYGPDIAGTLQNLCEVDSDDLLPDLHRVLAKNTESSRDSILIDGALLQARARTTLPIAEGNCAIVTKHTVDIFRSHRVYSDGVQLGEGLTPFAIVCQGHPNAQAARQALEDAGRVERGASLTLADARAIAVSDARLPTMLHHLVEKVYGYSLVLDLYLGATHGLASAIRINALNLGPALMALATYHGAPSTALRMGIRVVFQVQQHTFRWFRNRRATPHGTAVPVPDYAGLVSDVGSFLLSGVPELPYGWNSLILQENNVAPQEPTTDRIRGGAGTNAQLTVQNSRWDADLKKRWKISKFDKTSQMTANFQADSEHAAYTTMVPKFSDGQVACLNWACKGQCSSGCPRKAAHRQMGVAMIQAVHTLMDRCQMAKQ